MKNFFIIGNFAEIGSSFWFVLTLTCFFFKTPQPSVRAFKLFPKHGPHFAQQKIHRLWQPIVIYLITVSSTMEKRQIQYIFLLFKPDSRSKHQRLKLAESFITRSKQNWLSSRSLLHKLMFFAEIMFECLSRRTDCAVGTCCCLSCTSSSNNLRFVSIAFGAMNHLLRAYYTFASISKILFQEVSCPHRAVDNHASVRHPLIDFTAALRTARLSLNCSQTHYWRGFAACFAL